MSSVPTFDPMLDFLREPVDSYEGRLLHRRKWRGKKMSFRHKSPTDRIGVMVADSISEVARELWRQGRW